MHAIEGFGTVPAFLTKLWRLVEDSKTDDLISWTQNGKGFIIRNQARFSLDLLPQYYKHNNMASFVRQLNMYGFHKVVSADSGGLRVEKDEMEFAHPHFVRGQEHLIENIKRKQQRRLASDGIDFSQIPTSRTVILEDNKSITKLLMDVRDMKQEHDTMSTKMLGLKRENEALWREYANIRQKFTKQQQIIEKLIHFLIAMVKAPGKTVGPKRKFNHLALEGGDDTTKGNTKLSSHAAFTTTSPMEMVGGSTSTAVGGARIHEVTDLIDNDPLTINHVFSPDTTESTASEDLLQTVETTVLNQGDIVAANELDVGNTITPNSDTILYVYDPSNENEPMTSITTTDPVPVIATSIVSPGGTSLVDSLPTDMSISTVEEAPLSPDLLNTVDPSAVTQSFKYATSNTPVVNSSINIGTKGSPTVNTPRVHVPSTSKQIRLKPPQTAKVIKKEAQPSMSLAVPEKNVTKQDFQTHMDEIQTNIDSLHDLLTSGTYNVDPSMLLSMFSSDESNVPDLDSLGITHSGNELSVYNPSLLDLAGDIEAEDDDPLSFLNNSIASTSSSASANQSNVASSGSTGPSPPKQLRLNIKKERQVDDDDILMTPKVSPPRAPSPIFRGKKRSK